MIFLLTWLGVLLTALLLHYRKVYTKFSNCGVKNNTPIPLLGNMAKTLLGKEHFATEILNLYVAYPNERFVGRYEFNNAVVMIRDIDLIKKITVKDFEYFLDHRAMFSETDSFFIRSLFSMRGQEWKDMRSTLSPAFTSSKIRLMVPFMVEVGDQMIASLKKKIQSSKDGFIDVETKDLTSRYANDVIASCAFGLKVDSHTDENNEFYTMGKISSTFGFREMILFFIATNMPAVAKMFKLNFMKISSKTFFRNLVLGAMRDRESRNIIRPDMIHLLIEAKKEWSDDDLIAQAVLFFIAGFDTVSTATSFLLHELALNPDVQEKLAKEIIEHDNKNNGKFDLKSVHDMRYLDMVISEILRKWPPALLLDRICTKDYNLGRANNQSSKDFIIRKKTAVIIPAYGIHRDPRFYPNPEIFDPERFSEENKHKINPLAYMPFGIGPRNCIGSRFALCEVKVMIYQILLHMVVSPCEKTCIPTELCTKSFNVKIKGGHWLRFRTRT